MEWKIEIDEKALYDLEKLGKSVQKKIISYIKNRIANLENPRSTGKPLNGPLKGIWRYRVENFECCAKSKIRSLRC